MSGIDTVYIDAYYPYWNFYGNKIGTYPYLIGFNQNMRAHFDDHGMQYVLPKAREMLINISFYLMGCMKAYFYPLLGTGVGEIKKNARLYSTLNHIESKLKRKNE